MPFWHLGVEKKEYCEVSYLIGGIRVVYFFNFGNYKITCGILKGVLHL